MEIEGTTFGTITIDGKTYEHDVIIRRSGEVVKRKKKLSKKYYGTSHMLSKDEAKFVFEKGCEQLILGSGQMSSSLMQVTVVPVFTVTRSGAKANWSMCTSLVGAEPSAQSGGMSRWLCQWLGDCTPVSPRGRRARSPRSARAQAAGLMWGATAWKCNDHHTDQLHQAEKQIAEVRAVHHCDGHHEMSDLGADGEPVHSGAESGEPVWLHRAIGWVRSLA